MLANVKLGGISGRGFGGGCNSRWSGAGAAIKLLEETHQL